MYNEGKMSISFHIESTNISIKWEDETKKIFLTTSLNFKSYSYIKDIDLITIDSIEFEKNKSVSVLNGYNQSLLKWMMLLSSKIQKQQFLMQLLWIQ